MELLPHSRSFVVTLLAAIIASQGSVHAQFICTASCDSGAPSRDIAPSPAQCCTIEGVTGFQPLVIGSTIEQDCQLCSSLTSLQANISTSFTPDAITINRNAQFTCDITSANPNIELDATIQWIGPNGTVLAESGPNAQTLDLDFTPFQLSDVGTYECAAKVSSPTPGFTNLMSILSRSITFTPPTNLPISVSITQDRPPLAGEPYTLTCTITDEGQTIEWVDSEGNVIMTGDGIVVGETMFGGGETRRTLTFTSLESRNTGAYTCRNPIRDVTQRLVTDFLTPQLDISEPNPPALGEPYRPVCTATLPDDVRNGTLTVSWIAPDGSTILASASTMERTVSVELPISSLQPEDVGNYECRALLSSPFLDRNVFSTGTLTLGGTIVTIPPAQPVTTPSQPATTVSMRTPSPPPSTASPSQVPRTAAPTPSIGPGTPLPLLPVNECVLGTDNCSKDRKCFYSYQSGRRERVCVPVARCIDREDGFECRCNPGFEGDGVTCRDINECRRGEDNCHSDARCLNRPGSFKCKCRFGSIGDGKECCMREEDALRFGESQRAAEDEGEEDDEEEETSSRGRKSRRGKSRRSRRRAKSRKNTKSTKSTKSSKGTKSTTSSEEVAEPAGQAPPFAIDERCRAFAIAFNEENNGGSPDGRGTKSRSRSSRKKSRSTRRS